MTAILNALGQPIGETVPTWTDRRKPPRAPMKGQYASTEPLDPRKHGRDLFEAVALDTDGRIWTYLPYGPFTTQQAYAGWMQMTCLGEDPQFHAILDNSTGKAVGVASLMRIDPKGGAIEIGHICLSPLAQRSRVATEAMYLFMKRVFDEVAYRRYEWKCDALNTPSCKAAERLGFSFEGVFRQATVYKGRNRDTAWYSIIDKEWLQLKMAFETWLEPDNFEAAGRQKQALSALTAAALKAARGPVR
jgi:RimJ/RimL family protein N-acetyltransferase